MGFIGRLPGRDAAAAAVVVALGAVGNAAINYWCVNGTHFWCGLFNGVI
jgi:hypothetical protein